VDAGENGGREGEVRRRRRGGVVCWWGGGGGEGVEWSGVVERGGL
jgi:hypothetical protein